MRKIVKLMSVILVLSFVLFSFAGCGQNKENSTTSTVLTTASLNEKINSEDDSSDSASATDENAALKKYKAIIDIKNYGTITIELDSAAAPKTVANFVKLAKEKFYDGLTFHRIISGFMIQGGDPKGNGTGGSDETIIGEFAANGVKNDLSHTRGAVSMARSMDNNSASSQFFIVHKDSQYLDGNYAVFGYVTKGIEIVDKICEAAQPIDNNGTIPAGKQPIINSITISEE